MFVNRAQGEVDDNIWLLVLFTLSNFIFISIYDYSTSNNTYRLYAVTEKDLLPDNQ